MNVFLVFEDSSTWFPASNGDFYGAFSTREKAERFISAHPDGARGDGQFGMVIEECEMDKEHGAVI